jgi:hypothetical protein
MLHIKNKSVLETQLYETNVGWTVEVIGSDHGVMRPIMLFDTAVPISEARCEFDAADAHAVAFSRRGPCIPRGFARGRRILFIRFHEH